jgi:hypothetical protein
MKARIEALGFRGLPPFIYDDLDPFFRFDNLSNHTLRDLPWHYWLRWIYKEPNQDPPNSLGTTNFNIALSPPKGAYGPTLTFMWVNNFEKFQISTYYAANDGDDMCIGTLVCTKCVRHPRIIYVEELVGETGQPYQRCHLVCRLEDGRIWHGRGLDGDVPDFSDPNGWYETK